MEWYGAKGVFVGSSVLSFRVYDAVAYFKIGTKAAENVQKKLGMEPGTSQIV